MELCHFIIGQYNKKDVPVLCSIKSFIAQILYYLNCDNKDFYSLFMRCLTQTNALLLSFSWFLSLLVYNFAKYNLWIVKIKMKLYEEHRFLQYDNMKWIHFYFITMIEQVGWRKLSLSKTWITLFFIKTFS